MGLTQVSANLPTPHTQIEYGDWNSLGGSEVEAKEVLHRFCPRKFTHLALEHDQRYCVDGAHYGRMLLGWSPGLSRVVVLQFMFIRIRGNRIILLLSQVTFLEIKASYHHNIKSEIVL